MAEEDREDREALFCDTNVLVRLLSGDPPEQADGAARALADRSRPIVLADVVVAELAYVLVTQGKMGHADASAKIRTIIDLESVEVADAGLLIDTLDVWASARIDFADAYLAALNRGTSRTAVLSFDRVFDGIDGVERVEPGGRR